jgi:ankyrin repeat protein
MPELHDAVEAGKVGMVRELLERRNNGINERDEEGMTPIMLAVLLEDQNKRRRMVSLILHHSPNLHIRSEMDDTVMHLAADTCPPDILEKLIIAGGNINSRDKEGMTTLDRAMYCNNVETAELLKSLDVVQSKQGQGNPNQK